MTEILWLRRDLRRADHPALAEAAHRAREAGTTVLPVFVVDPGIWDHVGERRHAWLAANLRALREEYDGHLTLRHGDPAEVLPTLAEEVGATRVHVTRETTPGGVARDRRVAESLASVGAEGVATGTPYAVGPGAIRNRGGDPYQVFTPWARAWREHGWDAPVEAGDVAWTSAADHPRAVSALDLSVDGLPEAGERAALARWRGFDQSAYADLRDRPAVDGTSGLSAYLRLGVVHPRTLLAEATDPTFVTELGWREFYADVLHHHPESAWGDLRRLDLAHDEPDEGFEAWCAGRTGFPIVDAGMRQLRATGWMHNRVRMITASFLTKDLHVWWPHGARWFLSQLIDGDLASNNHGWQWVAGTGTDASPYFRVFNPVTQGKRFDPGGDYVRRWVPELAGLPGRHAHEPWKHGGAPGYPDPILDHAEERAEALRRYDAARR